MITKALEIRDRNTFIPVVAIEMTPAPGKQHEEERYLLRRSGYGFEDVCILLCRMEAAGVNRNATYDAYAWGADARTMTTAHLYIEEHWHELLSGDVIDVEFILEETKEKKTSERLGH